MKPINYLITSFFVFLFCVPGVAKAPILDTGETELDRNKALEVFRKANSAYEDGSYESALAKYQKVAKGYVSASLFFNIGNCYFKMKRIPEAILFYERAGRLDPGNKAIQHNLELARQRTVDKVEAVPNVGLAEWWKGVIMGRGPRTWPVFAIAFMVLASASFLFFFYSGWVPLRKTGFYLGTIFLPCSLFCVYASWQYGQSMEDSGKAIVMTDKVNVKGAPVKGSNDVFVLHAGTKVEVLETREKWHEIRIPDGHVGWIRKRTCESI